MSTSISKRRPLSRGCGAALSLAAAFVGLLAWASWRDNRLGTRFERITPGMTEAQVVELLGSPRWRGRCGSSDYYVFVQPIAGSRDCLVYSAAFAPFNPWYPVVYLDRSNRVIRAFPFGSP